MATWPAKTNYATGDVLTAAQMNDIGGELNDLYTSNGFAAGKNKVINGDFGIWQRGTGSFTADGTYSADRWNLAIGGSGTMTVTQQSFTAGTAPVAGYEGQYYLQAVTASTSGTSDYKIVSQYVEDVRTFAGQTITFSFWAKAGSGTPSIAVEAYQNFGSGGSSSVFTYLNKTAITTSWARYTMSVAIPSVSGKTIGSSSYLGLRFWFSAGSDFNSRTGSLGNQNATFGIWGVQLEAGSTASPFQTATGTIQGELAACQRYYYRANATQTTLYPTYSMGWGTSTTATYQLTYFPVTMRTAPSTLEYSNTARLQDGAGDYAITTFTIDTNATTPTVGAFTTAGSTGLTASRPYWLRGNNSTATYIAFSAEL